MKFKCEFQDFTGPEKSGLHAIMVDEKGGRALGLSTRHIREIQACWKVPGQGQKHALVPHVPEACRAECNPKGDQESPHACATQPTMLPATIGGTISTAKQGHAACTHPSPGPTSSACPHPGHGSPGAVHLLVTKGRPGGTRSKDRPPGSRGTGAGRRR